MDIKSALTVTEKGSTFHIVKVAKKYQEEKTIGYLIINIGGREKMATPKQIRQRKLRMFKGQIAMINGLTSSMVFDREFPDDLKRDIHLIRSVSLLILTNFNKVVGWKEK